MNEAIPDISVVVPVHNEEGAAGPLAREIAATPLPVYALGGLGAGDLAAAEAAGAHGVAAMRAAWR